jgi:hypothetical protein
MQPPTTVRRMSILALLVFLFQSSIPHVRTSDPVVTQMLLQGAARSPQFRALLDVIERSDVIVYIERDYIPRSDLVAMTRFVTHAGAVRYLRVTLDVRAGGVRGMSFLAHELQHVKEIALARWVVDDWSLQRLMRGIGYETRGPCCFDTAEAQRVGRRVADELQLTDAATIPAAR